MSYDDWKLAHPPEYDEPDEPECSCEPDSPYLCPSCERKAEEQPHGF